MKFAKIAGAISLVVLVALLGFSKKIWEQIDQNQMLITQDPFDGDLHFHNSAGTKMQNFGKVIIYDKVASYATYDIDAAESAEDIESLPTNQTIRFNDAGQAKAYVSCDFVLPQDSASVTRLYELYHNQQALINRLLARSLERAIYNSGMHMSATESARERRDYLHSLIEDQANNGIYLTNSRKVTKLDTLTNETRTITEVEILTDENGQPLRQENEMTLASLGIRCTNVAIRKLLYAKAVQDQIDLQRKLEMEKEVARSQAVLAQQQALTVVAQGRAKADSVKWAQEAQKARMVTIAEALRDSAKIDMERAEYEKQAAILRGQGEAEAKQLVFNADGALQVKLKSWETINRDWANALSKYPGNIVPQVNMTGGQDETMPSQLGTGWDALMKVTAARTALEVGVDPTVLQGRSLKQTAKKP